LKPETLRAWDDYVHKAIQSAKDRAHTTGPFLRAAQDPKRFGRVQSGEIVVWPAGNSAPLRVPSGLIHDWDGAAFIPNVHIDDVMSTLRDYARFKEIYKPGVLDAKVLSRSEDEDRFSMTLRNGAFFTKSAVEADYDSAYVRMGSTRAYNITCATRVQE